ncbi:MAG TPA: hypothetical protein VFZ83_08895 [Acidimicrobiia bacterium]|nr:hypothetical protein [Acidimicrobiia bacterium]
MDTTGEWHVANTERWFLKRGLPHFIAHYDASRDVWPRVLPALTLLFVLEAAQAINFEDEWPVWVNVLAVAAALALLVAGWAAVNRLRGRPAFARPVDLSLWEVAAFVVLPALVPIVFGTQWGTAALTLVGNAVLLAVIYFGASYGVVPMTRWAFGRLVRAIGAVTQLVLRALPLLLLFVTFLFVNTEVWQTAAALHWPTVFVVASLFLFVATAFAVVRLPRQLGELATFESSAEMRARLEDTPAMALLDRLDDAPLEAPALGVRQRANVALVVLVSEGIQILLVGLGLFVFFTVFGFLAIDGSVQSSWIAAAPDSVWTLRALGQRMVLSEELLRVAVFLASFSSLYFTVVLLTDSTYREEFLEEILDDVRESFAVRAVYLRVRGA